MRVPRYGFDKWRTLFTNRQLLALGTFVQETRRLDETMAAWPAAWREAVVAMLTPTISRLADRGSLLATWTNNPEQIRNTFARFALPMVWDFVEACPLADTTGGFVQAVEWTAEACEHLLAATPDAPAPAVWRRSAAAPAAADGDAGFDLTCTDPPYYDAIPYSDLMDFFHVWLRRALWGLSPAIDQAFETPLGPKWNAAANDGELIDDAARFDGDRAASKRNYEDGMARAFSRFHAALRDDVTTYYLLHRNDFGLGDAPIGACILYSISCNLSDRDLTARYDVLTRGGRASDGEPDDEEPDGNEDAGAPDGPGAGSRVRLKPWSRRTARSLGYRTPDGRPPAADRPGAPADAFLARRRRHCGARRRRARAAAEHPAGVKSTGNMDISDVRPSALQTVALEISGVLPPLRSAYKITGLIQLVVVEKGGGTCSV